MLKLCYTRPSIYARPVWLALLEKQLPFELIPVDLGGAQFEPDFLALNPFGHVPVLVDGSVRVIECLASLDYLEARYPEPSLLPTTPQAIATVRMVQEVTFNELLPAVVQLLTQGHQAQTHRDIEYAHTRTHHTLAFLENLLHGSTYFAGEHITLAEIVAGTVIPRLPAWGVDLTAYPRLRRWAAALAWRPAWRQIELTPAEQRLFRRQMRVAPQLWEQRRRQRITAWQQTQIPSVPRAATPLASTFKDPA
ncbi:MAG: glutathione S-transferase family protein [Cyanobacteria bacterium]|nr:glutathione S-transferase family protein [Cyanobacteriota bacterium]